MINIRYTIASIHTNRGFGVFDQPYDVEQALRNLLLQVETADTIKKAATPSQLLALALENGYSLMAIEVDDTLQSDTMEINKSLLPIIRENLLHEYGQTDGTFVIPNDASSKFLMETIMLVYNVSSDKIRLF